jgi:hypothetical protein
MYPTANGRRGPHTSSAHLRSTHPPRTSTMCTHRRPRSRKTSVPDLPVHSMHLRYPPHTPSVHPLWASPSHKVLAQPTLAFASRIWLSKFGLHTSSRIYCTTPLQTSAARTLPTHIPTDTRCACLSHMIAASIRTIVAAAVELKSCLCAEWMLSNLLVFTSHVCPAHPPRSTSTGDPLAQCPCAISSPTLNSRPPHSTSIHNLCTSEFSQDAGEVAHDPDTHAAMQVHCLSVHIYRGHTPCSSTVCPFPVHIPCACTLRGICACIWHA